MPELQHFDDGCFYQVLADYSWDFVFPSGKHERGRSESAEKAKEAIKSIHDAWVLQQWRKGQLAPKCKFIVPLT